MTDITDMADLSDEAVVFLVGGLIALGIYRLVRR